MMAALGQQDLGGAVEIFLTMWVDGPHRKPADDNAQVREQVRQMVTRALRLSWLASNCKGLDLPAIGSYQRCARPHSLSLATKMRPISMQSAS
jgi:hypothetical protein